jgi:phage tail sheath protein FI
VHADATDKRPANGSYPLANGEDGIEDADFTGTSDNKKGLHAFDEIDDINIVAIPDKYGDREVILAGLNYCKERKDCFFIADPPYGISPTDSTKGGVKEFKNGTTDTYKGNAFNSSYGALYYPWLWVSDPLTGGKRLIPPSGLVAGKYAYTDATRGVHKAPAGISEGYLGTAVGIERIVTRGEHDALHPLGINVIRSFPTSGICIWGASTLSADSEWKYVNVRRLLLYIEESIDEGSQWVVFEPNDPGLWGKVIRNVTAFLLRVWRDGALFGSTPEEAFFVKVDAENNPPEERDAGYLHIEVGVAPVKPAEFVVIQIKQKTQTK